MIYVHSGICIEGLLVIFPFLLWEHFVKLPAFFTADYNKKSEIVYIHEQYSCGMAHLKWS